jgi:hypothetical protein
MSLYGVGSSNKLDHPDKPGDDWIARMFPFKEEAKPPTKRDEARRSFAQSFQAKAGSKVRHSGSTELAEVLDLFVQATAGRFAKQSHPCS